MCGKYFRCGHAQAEIVFVNELPRYGLRLQLDAERERIATAAVNEVGFNPRSDRTQARELTEAESGVVYVAQVTHWLKLAHSSGLLGDRRLMLGEPCQSRVFFTVTFR